MRNINIIIIIIITILLMNACLPIPPQPPKSIYEITIKDCKEIVPSNPNSIYTKRAYHTVIYIYKFYVYIIGGTQDGGAGLNDVWYSENGADWELATGNAEFSPRWGHTSIFKDDKIWVIGGTENGVTGLNDVWYSENGVDWELATGNAEFSPRWGHTSVFKDGKIWVIGGTQDGVTGLNDVWYSENGLTWHIATGTAGFSKRWYHESIVHIDYNYDTDVPEYYDNILVIGGTQDGITGLNDVWSSKNGINWQVVTSAAGFGKRYGHKCDLALYVPQFIILIGGKDNDKYYNDIWWTKDEKTWKKINYNCSFNPRAGFGLLNNTIYGAIYGGYDGNNYFNDRWYIFFEHVEIYM